MDACSDTWEEEFSARKIKVKIKMKRTVTTNNQAQNSSHLNKKSRVIKKKY